MAKDNALSDQAQEATAAKMQRVAEAQSFHQANKGYFSLLYVIDQGRKQRSYPIVRLPEILINIGEADDSWISQSSFSRENRRLVNFRETRLLFSDLDTYKHERLKDVETSQQVIELLWLCSLEELPPPSVVVFSGRGLQAKWLLTEAVEARALLWWRACQRAIAQRLEPLCADHAALDPSRVLRVVGTHHSKTGELVRVVYGDPSAAVRYDFEELCERLVPRDRYHTQDTPREAPKRSAKARQEGGVPKRARRVESERWTPQTLIANARFWDLRKLIELRGGIAEGHRMLFLFWSLNFLCFIKIIDSEEALFEEARELVHLIDPAWDFDPSALSTLLHKSIDYANGGSVTHEGKTYPPLYTPRNDTLVRLLGITEEEQRELSSIRSSKVAEELRRETHERHNRKRGRVERSAYLASATNQELREKVLELHALGMSTTDISKLVGVSQQRVSKIIIKSIT